MTKEELKLVLFKKYDDYNKLSSVKILYDIIGTGLKRGKDLIDIIFYDNRTDSKPAIYILNFNIMWKNLTKEEKLKIRNYEYNKY